MYGGMYGGGMYGGMYGGGMYAGMYGGPGTPYGGVGYILPLALAVYGGGATGSGHMYGCMCTGTLADGCQCAPMALPVAGLQVCA